MTVVVGPSGAGKTTLLRAVAGLSPLARGTITLDGRDLAGVPTHRRRLAVVFQEPRLFPNLDTADNVAFPLRMAGVGATERRAVASALLDRVGLGGFAHRHVHELSGGEQQRVGLARALVADPDLVMFDEPMAAVDPNRRASLRRLVAELQAERQLTALYVTHHRTEAAELGDRLAVMVEGRILQHATPRDLFERPSSPVVARFLGSPNLITGSVRSGVLATAAGPVAVSGPDGNATVTIRPERVVVGTGRLELVVTEAAYHGTHLRVLLDLGGLTIEAHAQTDAVLTVGEPVRVDLPPEAVWRMPDTRDRTDATEPPTEHR